MTDQNDQQMDALSQRTPLQLRPSATENCCQATKPVQKNLWHAQTSRLRGRWKRVDMDTTRGGAAGVMGRRLGVTFVPLHHLNYNVLSVTSCVSISPFRSQLLPLLCGIVSLQTNPPRTWSQSLPKTSSRLSTKPATGQQPFICALDRVIRGWTEPDRQEPGSPDNKQFIKFTKTSTRLMG